MKIKISVGAHPAQESLLRYLLDLSDVDEQAVRFRCCQIISAIMSGLDENTNISEEVYELLTEKMLERTSDKVPIVRVFAACALSRLQDPENPSDPVTTCYTSLLSSDTARYGH